MSENETMKEVFYDDELKNDALSAVGDETRGDLKREALIQLPHEK